MSSSALEDINFVEQSASLLESAFSQTRRKNTNASGVFLRIFLDTISKFGPQPRLNAKMFIHEFICDVAYFVLQTSNSDFTISFYNAFIPFLVCFKPFSGTLLRIMISSIKSFKARSGIGCLFYCMSCMTLSTSLIRHSKT
jgi:hypothetical protein